MAVAFWRIVNSWLRVAVSAVSRAWMSEYWAVTSWPWVVIDLTVPMPRTRATTSSKLAAGTRRVTLPVGSSPSSAVLVSAR